jgi:hypothetical protein
MRCLNRALDKGPGGTGRRDGQDWVIEVRMLIGGTRRAIAGSTCRCSSSGWCTAVTGERESDMTYYEAALQVLRSVEHPLTTREITDRAIEQGLITPRGKTPRNTMSAELYTRGHDDPELIKIEDPGTMRAKTGSVRWTLRRATATRTAPKA